MKRPLDGEPFALDLCNTQWIADGRTYDALDDPAWTRSWLRGHGFTESGPEVVTALRATREALRAVLDTPGDAAEEKLNEVLRRGRTTYALRAGEPRQEPEVDAGWLPAWQAARNYLELAGERPDRLRRCANPACILHFFDTSRNGGRRWCSMEGCGNRTKAARHYQRVRPGA